MGKEKLLAKLSKLIAEYKEITQSSRDGVEIDLDRLRLLDKRKERLQKEIDQYNNS